MSMAALFDAEVRGFMPELGNNKNAFNDKACRLQGWMPRSPREAVLVTAQSLFELGLLKSG
ncbi:hypothetical protein [Paenibacillus periandrae]|uniref:hypothetical protein n=1 Tax=Paenibacillus periandrae TaxID=1761741 RepID=UPI001F089DD4|nr:hypothetical protein [Paenibacillus periandrae]